MKIAITGGAGFIGSHVVDRLIADGHEVISLDDLSLGTRKHFEHHLANEKFKFIELDVAETEKLKDIFLESKPDCVFHFAANSEIELGSRDYKVDFHKTFMTTISVLEAMSFKRLLPSKASTCRS